MIPTLVLVGGFLGSGKTTLLIAAARRLTDAGQKVGLIVNDLGNELVDSYTLRASGLHTREVNGGCFCCRFADFMNSACEILEESCPDVLIAEPVGSCLDLSATVLQPLRKLQGDRFRVAPLTVLVDPARAVQVLNGTADPRLAYLFKKQLAEADLVRYTKADCHSVFPRMDGIDARPISAVTGLGMVEWLDEVLTGSSEPSRRPAGVDYALYTEAELAFSWVNWRARVRLHRALTAAALAGPLLTRIERSLSENCIEIAHLKLFAGSTEGFVKASLCGAGEEPVADGALDAPPVLSHEVIINLRAIGDPKRLRSLVLESTRSIPGRITAQCDECFRPAPPLPEYRFPEAL